MKKNHSIPFVFIGLFFTVGVATSPVAPPFHQYQVTGAIVRSSGGEKKNFIVSLVGKFSQPGIDSVADINGHFRSSRNETGTSVTDSSGRFFLLISSSAKADSIAIKVSAPDKGDFIDRFFAVGDPSFTAVSEYHEEKSGCECVHSTDTPLTTITEYYRYDFLQLSVTIP